MSGKFRSNIRKSESSVRVEAAAAAAVDEAHACHGAK